MKEGQRFVSDLLLLISKTLQPQGFHDMYILRMRMNLRTHDVHIRYKKSGYKNQISNVTSREKLLEADT